MPRASLTSGFFALAAALALVSAPATANRLSSVANSYENVPTKAQRVTVPAVYAPGSIVIVNNERKLYYITGRGEALRYGVAVGNNAELWMGRTFVAAKAVDPKWIPVNGDDPVEGGDPANPLGKRALYLDWSLLRIHGTPARGSIGSATSNGCIRMLNEDVIDLFERVHLGAPVYAIKSWREATKYDTLKVTEKIYADPEAHRMAQEDLKLQIEAREEMKRLEQQYGIAPQRGTSFASAAGSNRAPQRQQQYRNNDNGSLFPPSWNSRSALGR